MYHLRTRFKNWGESHHYKAEIHFNTLRSNFLEQWSWHLSEPRCPAMASKEASSRSWLMVQFVPLKGWRKSYTRNVRMKKKTISLEIIPGSNCRDTSCNYLAFTYVHIFTSYSCPSEIPAPLSVPEPLQHQPHLWDQTDPSDSANTWLTTRLWWMMVVGPFPSWCGLVVNIRIWYCSDMLRSMQRVSFGTTHSAKASQSSSLCKPGGDMQCNWHSISKN